MLQISDLKKWLHRDLRQLDKLLLILASFDTPVQMSELRTRAVEAGFRLPQKWNPYNVLRRSKGCAIKTSKGWEIGDSGKKRLQELGVQLGGATASIAIDLREQLDDINDGATRQFTEEAIMCFEFGLYRSAIVMSWVAAVSVLHNYVCTRHLDAFNAEAQRVDRRWKTAKTVDDLNRMKESVFLDRLAGLSIIGDDVKRQLKECLNRRNSCGHPNSLTLGASSAAHHLEVLLLNVFTRFA